MKLPKLCRHKGQRRGYVTVGGKEHYFQGEWPDPRRIPEEIKHQYDDWILNYQLSRRNMPLSVYPDPTIDELWLGYREYIQQRYVKNGRPTSEQFCIHSACRMVARIYGAQRAVDFGPVKLKNVRQSFIDAGWERNYINKQVNRIRGMFRWASENELIPIHILTALQTVPALPRSDRLPEQQHIHPASNAVLAQTIPHLPKTLAALVRVHRLIGCRADEACIMRPCDLHRGAAVWRYLPSSSKTYAYYWVGPRAQEILGPLLEKTEPDGFLFPTRRRGTGHWTTASYRRAVSKVCKKYGIPRWSPLQIRHAAGQEARDKYGLEGTQARLCHNDITTSKIYAWNKDQLAQQIASEVG